ncbi:cytochrome c oxidase subunit II [Marinovum sp. 2_MG-2023]|uniref:cytochrome c oxidase subunit II n=1 Tax=Roseobacteraceae TaxID=2854170 RepID=UPI001FD10133|nr:MULTISPECIES: cytochrome c oxidase subunit II [Roseobacteraceae]MCJ7873036.1 cytochrome c oxidase subunit II [Phaeobacter sp. J2-8]MDO6730858.1 cytochrome c oxidase subunit II [Marinovum sp. 2_MG-2023]MDO6779937.1 cytochrome c oxidase subunit II [Marinovum sp. 1_MG-2023]
MRLKSLFTGLTATFVAGSALAQDLEVVGKPIPNGIGFQPAATELARELQWLDGMLLWIITIICVFVAGLMVFVFVRFNRKSNPTPATFTHNTPIEVAWTIVPIVILVLIGAFSLPVLFKQQEIPEGDIVIKATGYQWYWGYEYVDAGIEGVDSNVVAFDSFMLGRDDLAEAGYSDDLYLLATDTQVVVPVNKTVVMQITGADVIHSWTIPAFGVKQDAVPGRIAELWFKAEKEGIYFGQCSELCGKDHAYMPITVKVVSEEAYADWMAAAVEEYAGLPLPFEVAAAE